MISEPKTSMLKKFIPIPDQKCPITLLNLTGGDLLSKFCYRVKRQGRKTHRGQIKRDWGGIEPYRTV